MRKRILCLILSLVMVFSLLPAAVNAEEAPVSVYVAGTRHYDNANEVLELVQAAREENQLPALERNTMLSVAAVERAAELALYYDIDHVRPDGSDASTITKGLYTGWTLFGENIAIGKGTPEEVMAYWMNMEVHRNNILSQDYTQIGIGCFISGDTCCWVQLFGNSTTETENSGASGTETLHVPVQILPSLLNLSPEGQMDLELELGETYEFTVTSTNPGYPEMKAVLAPSVHSIENQQGWIMATAGIRDDGVILITAEDYGIGSRSYPVYDGQPDPLVINLTVPGGEELPPPETTEPEHYHSFSKWTVTEFPSATSDGEKYATCTTCGYVQTENAIYMEEGHPDGHYVYSENPVHMASRDLSISHADPGHDVFLYYPGADDLVVDSIELLSMEDRQVIGTVEELGGGYYHFLMPDEDTIVMINTHRIADYTVTVISNDGGSVSISAHEVNEGETILLTAIPERGYVIDQIHLYTDGTYAPSGVQLNETNFEITIPDGNVVIEVSFLCTINPFKDVKTSDYFYHPVMWAVSNGVTSGIDATHFAPGQACTRAQVVTFLWRAAGRPSPISLHNPFDDVKKDAYYYEAVLWAVENGITTGMDKYHFAPNSTCTRAQVVTFLWRACGADKPESSKNPFSDVRSTNYYYDAVLWAVENGITTGVDKTHFGPNSTCTRGQVVTFLYRTIHG